MMSRLTSRRNCRKPKRNKRKMKKNKEIAALGKTELSTRLIEFRKELMKYKSQVAMGTAPKKTSAIHDLRKNIARVLTAMRRKQ